MEDKNIKEVVAKMVYESYKRSHIPCFCVGCAFLREEDISMGAYGKVCDLEQGYARLDAVKNSNNCPYYTRKAELKQIIEKAKKNKFPCMYDYELDNMLVDIKNLFNDLGLWQSGDTGEEDYRKAVKKFKDKWYD